MHFFLNLLQKGMKPFWIDGVMWQYKNMFNTINNWSGIVSTNAGADPASFSPEVFSMVHKISQNVIVPIGMIFLTYVACFELINIIKDYNNFHDNTLRSLFLWIAKTAIGVMLVTKCWDIVMAIFAMGQWVVRATTGILSAELALDPGTLDVIRQNLENYPAAGLFGLWFSTLVVAFLSQLIAVVAYAIVIARIFEIYMTISLAPIPFSTLIHSEHKGMGQNYIKSLFALAFQGFLIMILIAIYIALAKASITSDANIGMVQLKMLGAQFVLMFMLFRTGSIAKSIFGAS
ncbi:MAG: hypothetical protein KHZ87_04805 [Clostridiales bacterium]|nr:hypothetical protein [Clostridiales bacterium]MBS5877847.1 hypothetical protein [Clostridiales bacterium]